VELPHNQEIVMETEMEYLTQVITVLITLTQDALKKERLVVQQPHSKSNLLLLLLIIIGLGIRQDRWMEDR
jgi:hypothetical protein